MPSVATFLCAASRIIGNTYLFEVPPKPGTKETARVDYRLRLGPNPFYITKVTRKQGSPCPEFINVKLDTPVYDILTDIVNGNWKEESVKKEHKSRRKHKK
jgi:hypothetical protein